MSSKLTPTESPVEGKIGVQEVDPGILEAAISSERRVFLQSRFGTHITKWLSSTPPARWLSDRQERKRARLAAIEAKCSAFLATCANQSVRDCLTQFNSSTTGLDETQLPALLEKYGLNNLSAAKPRRWWSILLACLPNPFNILLSVLAIISIATLQWATFVILVAMVILSVGLRFWQELKSNVAMNELILLVHDNVKVIRNGIETEVTKTLIVPGDIIRLCGGDMVPADVKLVDTSGLYVSQSTLTGENTPVLKQLEEDESKLIEPQSILESTNICFAGTTIASGSATAVVVATGDDTYIGALSQTLAQSPDTTEFERGVRRVSYLLITFMLIMVPIVLIIAGFVSKNWDSAALFCISVAVGITPEMLPMIINANLCHAALKLAKHKVVVKRLNSVQSLGAIDVLCSDKTGTLTKDEITLHKIVDAENSHSTRTLQYAFLNAFLQEGLRNGIDLAIVKHAESCFGAEELEKLKQEHQKVAELPFDFDRRLLSIVVCNSSKDATMITKGAAEEVISKCDHVYMDGERRSLDSAEIGNLMALNTSLNEQGLRTVAVASRTITMESATAICSAYENNLTFDGFLAFLDPPKDDAAQALEDLRKYGVAVKILTGDSVAAARTVANQIGLLNLNERDKIISGPELAGLEEKEMQEKVESCIVFAKLKPLQKQQIVRMLISAGHSVGFLGDGVNDAPALRSADVGISVDSGTPVAKHAANIILLQKSLAHVVNGVVYGRITHANTMKYIKMAASSNFGNIFSVTIASSWLPFVPMAPLQLLLQNLLYDFSQAVIPWDRVDPEMIALPRTWNVWGIARFMIWLGPTSSVFDIVTFSLGWFYYGIRSAEDTVGVQTFQTQWFTEGLLTQLLIVIMLRTQHIPIIQASPARIVGGALTIIAAIGLMLPYLPTISRALQMREPHPTFYGFLVAILVSYMGLVQLVKTIYRRIYKEWV